MSAPTLPADPPDLRANIKNAARWLLDEAAHGRWGPIETVPPVVPTDARMARGVADLLIALADNRDLWRLVAIEKNDRVETAREVLDRFFAGWMEGEAIRRDILKEWDERFHKRACCANDQHDTVGP